MTIFPVLYSITKSLTVMAITVILSQKHGHGLCDVLRGKAGVH
jgi:hypothetical protein